MSTPLVVAIDGPSGSGKSSTSRGVASQLGLTYLDTGAMYRAMTWALMQRGVDLTDALAVARSAKDVKLEVGVDPIAPTIEVDGEDVSEAIRRDDVTASVSLVAAVSTVREQLVKRQQSTIASTQGIVVEGRDIGSTVAPDAPVKIYLVADPAARAARRAAEAGHRDTAAIELALAQRDQIDSTREASPLTKADDAIVIDGTFMTLDEVIAAIVDIVRKTR